MAELQQTNASYAFLTRHASPSYVPSEREGWDLYSTQTALYNSETDEFDRDELERQQERIEEKKREDEKQKVRARYKVWILFSALVGSLLRLGQEVLTTLEPFPQFKIAIQTGFWLIFGVGAFWYFYLEWRFHSASEQDEDIYQIASQQADIRTSPRQLFLNAGKMRFAFGDLGFLAEGDNLRSMYEWREFRNFWVYERKNGPTHLQLNLEGAHRTEFIVVPYDRFFSGRDGLSWTSFVQGLARRVEQIEPPQRTGGGAPKSLGELRFEEVANRSND